MSGKSIEQRTTLPERFFKSTNKWNPIYTDGGTKSAVDPRIIRSSSIVYPWDEKHFLFVAADQWTGSIWSLTTICLCKPFSCKACPGMQKQNQWLTRRFIHRSSAVYQQDEKRVFSWLLTSGPTLCCLKTLFIQGMSGKKITACLCASTNKGIPM